MSEGKAWARALIVVFVGGEAQGSIDKLSKLVWVVGWGLRVVPSCLIAGYGVI